MTSDPAVLARLLTVSAVGTEALLGAGRLAAAEKLAQASVAAAAFLRRDDPAALTARGYLARTLVRRGRSGEAETIYRELLADRIRVQGEDHLDTLATRHDLAAAMGVQGRFGEAEQLYRRLLADDDRLRGAEHRETLAARYNLARMIGLQGRYDEADELSRQVLRGTAPGARPGPSRLPGQPPEPGPDGRQGRPLRRGGGRCTAGAGGTGGGSWATTIRTPWPPGTGWPGSSACRAVTPRRRRCAVRS